MEEDLLNGPDVPLSADDENLLDTETEPDDTISIHVDRDLVNDLMSPGPQSSPPSRRASRSSPGPTKSRGRSAGLDAGSAAPDRKRKHLQYTTTPGSMFQMSPTLAPQNRPSNGLLAMYTKIKNFTREKQMQPSKSEPEEPSTIEQRSDDYDSTGFHQPTPICHMHTNNDKESPALIPHQIPPPDRLQEAEDIAEEDEDEVQIVEEFLQPTTEIKKEMGLMSLNAPPAAVAEMEEDEDEIICLDDDSLMPQPKKIKVEQVETTVLSISDRIEQHTLQRFQEIQLSKPLIPPNLLRGNPRESEVRAYLSARNELTPTLAVRIAVLPSSFCDEEILNFANAYGKVESFENAHCNTDVVVVFRTVQDSMKFFTSNENRELSGLDEPLRLTYV